MNITIDSRPFSITEYYNGEYRNEEKAYKFTISSGDNLSEVTWCDDKPEEHEIIEQKILFNFLSKD